MKKSLLALAVLGAFAGVASAQSSVTLFGTVDVNGRYVKADGTDRRSALSHGRHQQQPARLPWRRGSGWRPEGRLQPARRRQRRHRRRHERRQVLQSPFDGQPVQHCGELRLGRDYTPTFWNHDDLRCVRHERPRQLDSTSASGTAAPVRTTRSATSCRRTWAASTARSWPAPREGGTTARPPGRYLGGRVGFAAGPFDVAGCVRGSEVSRRQRGVRRRRRRGVPRRPAGDKQKTWNVGGSWDFGFLKLMGYYDEEKFERRQGRDVRRSARVHPVRPGRNPRWLRPQRSRLRRRRLTAV